MYDENYMPGYTTSAPNANTPTILQLEQPLADRAYNHLQRLSDKLLGAFVFKIDRAIDDSMYEDSVTEPVRSDFFIKHLPPETQTFIARNLTAITVVSMLAIAAMVFSAMRR